MNPLAPRSPLPRVLVLGASGFLGRHVVHALRCAGATVVRGVRRAQQADEIAIDFTCDLDPDIWRPRLNGIDVVVNAVGILQVRPDAPFDAIHRAAPLAVLRGCELAGVRRFIQISALGSGATRDPLGYFATKTAAEEALLASTSVTAVIIRPSLVFGEDGASSAVMLAAASLPIQFLPGDGAQLVQPVHVDDLALLGTGAGTAFALWGAHRRGTPEGIALVARNVVTADWVFTTPAVVLQPLTGSLRGWPLSTPWIVWSLVLYGLIGACWPPVVWLQLRLARSRRRRGCATAAIVRAVLALCPLLGTAWLPRVPAGPRDLLADDRKASLVVDPAHGAAVRCPYHLFGRRSGDTHRRPGERRDPVKRYSRTNHSTLGCSFRSNRPSMHVSNP